MRRVSIIGPCRNEERHLGAFAASALAQRLPAGWTLEIVIADGMGDDGTRRALEELAARDPRVSFVDPTEPYWDTGPGWTSIGGESHSSLQTTFDEAALRDIRQQCRALALTNEFAINGHENRISYLVGSGHTCADRGAPAPTYECRYLWYFETGPLHPDNVGFCWDPDDYLYDWDNDVGTPDTGAARCSTIATADQAGQGCAPY